MNELFCEIEVFVKKRVIYMLCICYMLYMYMLYMYMLYIYQTDIAYACIIIHQRQTKYRQ